MTVIEPASQAARIALAIVVALLIIAALLVSLYTDQIERWVLEDSGQTMARLHVLLAGFAALSLPLLIGAAVAVRLGLRTVASERYPPQGALLIADTQVETGASAVRRGRVLAAAGLLVGLIALCAPAVLWLLFRAIVVPP